jgi:hypothetical protein
MIAQGATKLACDRQPYEVQMAERSSVRGRAVIIATGVEYRRLALANLSQFEGAGVYYTALPMEAQLCIGEEIIVVGGAIRRARPPSSSRRPRSASTCWFAETGWPTRCRGISFAVSKAIPRSS